MIRRLSKGFTLVELLIVIGLLGAIALIVIAAINPIEQANRARDARFKADGGQIISAIDRYFASHSTFPWMDADSGYNTSSEFAFTSAGNPLVGLCSYDTGDCTDLGYLMTSNELKNEFLSRDFIKGSTAAEHSVNTTNPDLKIFIGKGPGSSSSVYACYYPLSKTNKQKALDDDKVRSLSFDTTTGIPNDGTCSTVTEDWEDTGCVVCIPE